MTTLVSFPAWVVVSVSLVCFGAVAVLSRVALHRWITDGRDGITSIAGPLMPALGATFALLAALALSGEATQMRSAEQDVGAEAAAASRLAWSSADAQPPLVIYLRSTRANEWKGTNEAGSPDTMDALADLERTVRGEAASKDLGSAQAGEMLGALDTLTSLRRTRLATRSHQLPEFYLLVLVTSGLALVINSAALAVEHPRRVAAVTGGLVVVVALVLALLLAVSAPFRGGFITDGDPIDTVVVDIESGAFAS